MTKNQSHVLSIALVASAIVLVAAPVCAQTFTAYPLSSDSSNFCYPSHPGNLAQGRDGNLYSTAPFCDLSRPGAVFEISPNGLYNELYNFDGVHGSAANSGLTLGTDGNFYGATTTGGADNSGTIFRVTSTGTLATLYSFTNGTDGGGPYGPPIQGADGNFYGTTSTGTAYKITPSGNFTALGAIPGASYAPLILAADGYLYGTTLDGGSSGFGTVFKMSYKGVVTIVYSFDGIHGRNPVAGVIQASGGNFCGTTLGGGSLLGGVVFKLTPQGAITVLHNFDPNGLLDGYRPTAALVQATDGNFYGAAAQGGGQQRGLIFELTSAGAYVVIYQFSGFLGDPESSLMQHTNGKIYGTVSTDSMYSLDVGLAPFVKTLPTGGRVGRALGILGGGLTGATSVKFNGTDASFTVVSDTYISTTVPSGATTGHVTVTTPSGTLSSNVIFRVAP